MNITTYRQNEHEYITAHNNRIVFLKKRVEQLGGVEKLYKHLVKVCGIGDSFTTFKKQYERTKNSNGLFNRLELMDIILSYLGIPASDIFGGIQEKRLTEDRLSLIIQNAFEVNEYKKKKKEVRIVSARVYELWRCTSSLYRQSNRLSSGGMSIFDFHIDAIKDSDFWLKNEIIQYLDAQIRYGVNQNDYKSYEINKPNFMTLPSTSFHDNTLSQQYDRFLNTALLLSYEVITLKIWMNFIEKKVCLNFESRQMIEYHFIEDIEGKCSLKSFIHLLNTLSDSIIPLVDFFLKKLYLENSGNLLAVVVSFLKMNIELNLFLGDVIDSFISAPPLPISAVKPEILQSLKLNKKNSHGNLVGKRIPLTEKMLKTLENYVRQFSLKMASDQFYYPAEA